MAKAVEYASRIMVEVLLKLYDTRRVARITGEDGTEDLHTSIRNSPQAMQKISTKQARSSRSTSLLLADMTLS